MIMKYRNLLLIIALVSSQSISYAQTGVSVNNNGTAAHEKAILRRVLARKRRAS